MVPERLILASGSPRRRHLLEERGLRFEVRPAEVEELVENGDLAPAAFTLENAGRKAAAVSAGSAEALVLAADTTVVYDGRVFNKPADLTEAEEMLLTFSGQQHRVVTGVVLEFGAGGCRRAEAVESTVVFKPLSREQIQDYFRRVNPLDKAGAYGIQEGGELIIDRYEGSFSNIMGLPMEWVEAALAHWNWLDLFLDGGV